MQPAAPLDYQAPLPARPRWFGLAAAGLALHWLLLFGWGLGLNDVANGYLYCRLAMPDDLDLASSEWVFSAGVLVVLIVCGVIDRTKLKVSRRAAVYPSILFVLTQLLTVWLSLWSFMSVEPVDIKSLLQARPFVPFVTPPPEPATSESLRLTTCC